jgi:hypothetical protein
MINDICNPLDTQEGHNVYSSEFGTTYKASGNVLVVKRCYKTIPPKFEGSSRGVVSGFSDGSGRRMRKYLRECMADYQQMLTLTYPFSYPIDGSIIKNHLRKFLQEMRREWLRSASSFNREKEYSAFWFLEFQERGAPHFHIFATWSPSKEWVSETWYRIVQSDDIRHLRAGTRVEFLRAGKAGTISYASKYAAKMSQKVVPDNYLNCGRFWGVSGRRGTMSADTFITAADTQKSNVKEGLTRFIRRINKLLFIGTMESLYRDQDTFVFIVHSEIEMKKIRVWIARFNSMVSNPSDLFEDAELS